MRAAAQGCTERQDLCHAAPKPSKFLFRFRVVVLSTQCRARQQSSYGYADGRAIQLRVTPLQVFAISPGRWFGSFRFPEDPEWPMHAK